MNGLGTIIIIIIINIIITTQICLLSKEEHEEVNEIVGLMRMTGKLNSLQFLAK